MAKSGALRACPERGEGPDVSAGQPRSQVARTLLPEDEHDDEDEHDPVALNPEPCLPEVAFAESGTLCPRFS